jgi:hypothetical protein
VDSWSTSVSLDFSEEADANFGSSENYEETDKDETPAQALLAKEMKEELID